MSMLAARSSSANEEAQCRPQEFTQLSMFTPSTVGLTRPFGIRSQGPRRRLRSATIAPETSEPCFENVSFGYLGMRRTANISATVSHSKPLQLWHQDRRHRPAAAEARENLCVGTNSKSFRGDSVEPSLLMRGRISCRSCQS
jgi:hypothetical protein